VHVNAVSGDDMSFWGDDHTVNHIPAFQNLGELIRSPDDALNVERVKLGEKSL
jgi:hypothetical protein